MSDANEAEAFFDAIPYEESDDDNEINPDLDQDSDEDYEFEDMSDIEDVDDIEMDPSAWVLAKLNKKEKTDTTMVVYNPDIQKFRDMAEQVKRARIKVETRQQYNNANVVYVSWMFHNFKGQFHKEALEKLNEAYFGGQEPALLEAISTMIFDEEICPIDPHKFEAVGFFAFLMTFKSASEHYFSYSTYDGKRSALMHMMKFDQHHIRYQEMDELKKMMTGLRKSILQQKKDLGLSVSEGKDSMPFEAFKLMCELMIKESTMECVFAVSWLTTQWNLISRSEATETISFSQIYWGGDHVKIFFPKHKSDQFGEQKDEPRHMYCNPVMPSVCAIRALGQYLICFPDVVSEGKRLFPGNDQRSRFNRVFHYILSKYSEVFLGIGVDPKDLGTHSIRKGAATYCCAGVHPGPPVVSVCLRAGWSLGRVKERYLKYEIAGDELVGRVLTGIPPMSDQFGTSPIYYNVDDESNKFASGLLNYVFPKHPPSLKKFLNICLATTIYHENYVKDQIDNDESPVHTTAYFKFATAFENKYDFVTRSLPWENKPGSPPLTGIPIHCHMLNKLIEIHQMQKDLPKNVVDAIKSLLDDRMIGDAGSILARRVMERVDKVSEEISDELRTKYNMTGEEVNNTNNNNMNLALMSRTMFRNSTAPPSENKPQLLFPEEGIYVHFWDGAQRSVPKNFSFPRRMTLQTMWQNWHLPSISDKVSAYKHFKNADLMHIKPRGVSKYNDMRLIIHELENAIKKFPNLYEEYLKNLHNLPVLIEILEKVKHIFHTTKTRKTRLSQLSWESLVRDAREMFRLREKGIPPPPSSSKRKTPRKPKKTKFNKKAKETSATVAPSIPPMPARANLDPKKKRAVRKKPTLTKRRYPIRNRARPKDSNAEFGAAFKQTDESIILSRGRGSLFEKVTCAMCNATPTQHRCTIKKKGSGLIDAADGSEICGYPVCSICRGEYGNEGGPCRCKEHFNMTDV